MKRFFSSLLFFLAAIASSWAVTPMEYYNSLVAGGENPGFRDGSFVAARFNNPLGLAMDESGTKLYVADTYNNRIRVVHLDQNNAVETLAGTDASGSKDGPVSTATFMGPARLALLPGNRLAVYDGGSHNLRMIDFQSQAVTTLQRGAQIMDMVYCLKDDSLYFLCGR